MTELSPPPWLWMQQRLGPPPLYPNLKIPGVNAPIPPHCQLGYFAEGWGRYPVDEQGRPLYGDVFGTYVEETEKARIDPEAVKLIVVDGVFSMEGDLANLPEIVRLKKKYNASIYVDEAHGLGVFGQEGRGVCDHFGVTADVDLIMGTFSKSLASIGGFVAGDKEVINWLRHNARSYIFQASNTPAATAAAREAIRIIRTEPERIKQLWDITNYALKSFRDAGFEIGDTESPIIPLYVRDTDKTFTVTKLAFDEGIFINPVIPPACAPQDTLVRVALMATHTKQQVDFAVEKLSKCFKALGILQ